MSLTRDSITTEMASKKRNYLAFVPVAISVRFVLRLPLLAQLQLQELMLALMVKYAQMCAVEIFWYELRPNHLHITALQETRAQYRCTPRHHPIPVPSASRPDATAVQGYRWAAPDLHRSAA